ncbi:ParB/RepB/Spo0J family partition protein [Paludicola sp. MB14-C6]|uniref:ParB/RepB/Spo0J family partition protein n=1 Tax=Paludihabitans sp. MB14-C6 TaxID=3070656 RepID=UPI0027DD250C|nr:ParB/RepB/Spo0J family partition protein [Paludicola sp. MB14-C6]WMJ22868.1 ParB/RepB/Spo0J family partition protein [Paludicola sp. MB14-C6]
MAKSNTIKLNLPSADSLFSTQEMRDDAKREKVMEIPLSEISDFPNHPYHVEVNNDMAELVDSIKNRGLLHSALVRPKSDGQGYEMVAGHRRKKAYELAGIEKLPCIIREMTDDEAVLSMVDSNLQRERILPSEKAFAYKMRLEAMSRQGRRTDLTSVPLAQKLSSRETLGNQVGESQDQVRRFIRLTELIKPILDMVDENKIAFRPAVELSYLSKEEQQCVFNAMECEECTPSLAQAIKMKQFSQNGKLNDDVILSILSETKPNQKEKISFARDKLEKYIPKNISPDKTEDYVIKALEHYHRFRERQQKER